MATLGTRLIRERGEAASATVVVLNYNYARFLRRSLDSALSQTWPRVQVVVVDDCSTDDSREVIASYGRRVRTVLQERNGGHGAAMNAGFAASSVLMVAGDSEDWDLLTFEPRKNGPDLSNCCGERFNVTPHKRRVEYVAKEADRLRPVRERHVDGIDESRGEVGPSLVGVVRAAEMRVADDSQFHSTIISLTTSRVIRSR